jgi:hypothetical protein
MVLKHVTQQHLPEEWITQDLPTVGSNRILPNLNNMNSVTINSEG